MKRFNCMEVSDLRDYSDVYIVVKGTIDPLADVPHETDRAQLNVAFKNNAPLRSSTSKFNSILIDNAEILDFIMPIYDLSEYSDNYSMTYGSLQKYYRDKVDDVDDNASEGESFEYETKIIGKKTEQQVQLPQKPQNPDATQPLQPPQASEMPVPFLNKEVTIPLKYLSNFQRSLDLSLMKWEKSFIYCGQKTAYLQNIIIT